MLDVGGMADGDDILAGNEGQQPGGVGWGSGTEDDGGDEEAGHGGQLGNGSMDWDEQWRRMSLDERLLVELSSVGLLPAPPVRGWWQGSTGMVWMGGGVILGCVRAVGRVWVPGVVLSLWSGDSLDR